MGCDYAKFKNIEETAWASAQGEAFQFLYFTCRKTGTVLYILSKAF